MFHHNRLLNLRARVAVAALLLTSLFISSCGGGGAGSLAVPSVVTTPTFCTGGNAASAQLGQPYYTYPANMNWSFQGVYQDSNTVPRNYTNLVSSAANRLFKGKTLTTVAASRPLGGTATNAFYFTDAALSQEWTPVVSGASSIPIDQFQFPLMVGKRCSQSIAGINFGDVDGDGIADIGSLQIDTTVLAFENITVPAKTYLNAAKTSSALHMKLTISSTGAVLHETDTYTEWRVKNVGLVKQIYHATVPRGNTTFTADAIEVLDSRFSKLPYAANDIIYDPVSGKLYASIASNAPTNADQIVAIDPLTGGITGSVQLANNPGPLALSSDGSKLYVGMHGASEVRSVNLPAMTANPAFLLGRDPVLGALFAGDIKVLPGDPASVAIALSSVNAGGNAGVAVYSNGVKRINQTASLFPRVNWMVFGNNANVLYGINSSTSGGDFTVMNVSATGVRIVSTTPNLATSFLAKTGQFANGLVYLSDGTIIDPVALVKQGSFVFPQFVFGTSVLPDIANNRVYFLQSETGVAEHIQTFNATTKTSISLVSFPSTTLRFTSTLQKIGTNRFAFHTYDFPTSTNKALWKVIFLYEAHGI